LRSIPAVLFGIFIVFAGIIVTALAIQSMQDFAANSPFFQSDMQAQIQGITLAALVPVAFGLILIIYGAWPQQEIPITSQPTPTTQPEVQQVIEKEVVIVKIRCAYCNTLYDATLDRCPYCGATH
jgi:uncharacterized membrane protein